MEYLILFLEGIITFISPCLLPMLPIYISYFAGGNERKNAKTLLNSVGFVLGFTVMFVLMGALAGTIGTFLTSHRTLTNIISGIIVIFFGLNFMGVFKLNIFKGASFSVNTQNMGFFSSLIFGFIFSIGWTPCVGTFLGTALTLAAREGSVLSGVIMLLVYSLGLGIPFVLSALLIDKLKSTFNFIKRNYNVINIISGVLLVTVGIFMAFGLLDTLLGLLG